MSSTLTIEGKMLGQRQPLFDDWSLSLPPEMEDAGGRLTLRDLITRIVREEVTAFRERQQQRRVTRAFTGAEIAAAVTKGKVDMGGRDLEQEVDPEAAVAAALQAFEDGLYHVFMDGEQKRDLDQEVYLKPDSRLTFLRLVALAGG